MTSAEETQRNLVEMFRAMLQDRQQQEAEQRAQHEEERRARGEELARERALREDVLTRREGDMQMQIELLRDLVEGIHRQGREAAVVTRAERERDVKVTKLREGDDIEAYLTTFERVMTAYEVPKARWSFKLAPQLVGKAQQAYAALGVDEASDYEQLKQAVLRRYDINEESHRRRFRTASKKDGETNRELVTRLDDFATKWLQGCCTVQEVKDRVVLEQLLNSLPENVRIWVMERKPKSSEEAGKLADDYAQARRQNDGRRSDPTKKPMEQKGVRCHRCQKIGHLAKDCRASKPGDGNRGKDPSGGDTGRQKRDLSQIECFNCHQKGHYSSNCPRNAMFCRESRLVQDGRSTVTKRWIQRREHESQMVKPGAVEGNSVNDVVLDTGCSRTLVQRKLVPEEKLLLDQVVAIRCAHGDTVLYPLAQIKVELDGRTLDVEAAVSDTLPVSMLLGTDVPELTDLLEKELDLQVPEEDVLMVTTRAAGARRTQEEGERQRREAESGGRPRPLEELGERPQQVDQTEQEMGDWMADLDEDLFGVPREKQRKTRGERRIERRRHQMETAAEEQGTETTPVPTHALDVGKDELKKQQDTDETLAGVREAADGQPSTAGVGFFRKEGLVYRRWTPPGRDADLMTVEQLVLPRQYRGTVLELAHAVPMAGHLGKQKTAQRILQRFYWPTLFRDVAEFCRSCGSCQKLSKRKPCRAPLIPLPVLEEPFSRIAMDIVGPLPRSHSGKRYILVVCDYATRYPEAILLKSIEAECVAEELVTLFSRMGIPKEILTDQGSNFTSQLLTEVYHLLHVHPMRTTPYHPQTDGLVERFNQTLCGRLCSKKERTGTGYYLTCCSRTGRCPKHLRGSLPSSYSTDVQ